MVSESAVCMFGFLLAYCMNRSVTAAVRIATNPVPIKSTHIDITLPVLVDGATSDPKAVTVEIAQYIPSQYDRPCTFSTVVNAAPPPITIISDIKAAQYKPFNEKRERRRVATLARRTSLISLSRRNARVDCNPGGMIGGESITIASSSGCFLSHSFLLGATENKAIASSANTIHISQLRMPAMAAQIPSSALNCSMMIVGMINAAATRTGLSKKFTNLSYLFGLLMHLV